MKEIGGSNLEHKNILERLLGDARITFFLDERPTFRDSEDVAKLARLVFFSLRRSIILDVNNSCNVTWDQSTGLAIKVLTHSHRKCECGSELVAIPATGSGLPDRVICCNCGKLLARACELHMVPVGGIP